MDAMVWENLQTLQGGFYCRKMPMSDQDRVSSYYIILYNIMQTSDENKKKYQLWDY